MITTTASRNPKNISDINPTSTKPCHKLSKKPLTRFSTPSDCLKKCRYFHAIGQGFFKR